jgi:hypothetical protein
MTHGKARGAGVNTRGSAVRRLLGAVAGGAALACLVAGCSEVGFPAVHDMPAPRAEAPLTPDQVKQATDDLISERNHLSTEVQSNGQPSASPNAPVLSPQKTSLQPAGMVTGDPQTAGAGVKP